MLVREGTHVATTKGFVAIEDINPQAEVHLLVIPERHVDSFREIGEFPAKEVKRMLEFAAETARGAGLEDYQVQVNVGPGAGQRAVASLAELHREPEPLGAAADRLDHSGEIGSDARVLRHPPPRPDPREVRTRDAVPLDRVDRRRAHADEHLVVLRRRDGDLAEVEDTRLRAAVALVDDRCHRALHAYSVSL